MTTRVAGCDLGKVSACFVLGHVEAGALVVDEVERVLHEGKPLEAFARWYRHNEVHRAARLAATGLFADALASPAELVPEDACQEAALADRPRELNLVSIGGRGYSVLARTRVTPRSGGGAGESFEALFLENDKCSSGAGENIQKMAARFGLDVDEADALALSAAEGTPITARCSVFAKSEMTHYANQGKPASELFRGFFASVARNAGALVARHGLDAPVLLIGGCARLRSIVGALEEVVGREVIVPDRFDVFEALGAAHLAVEALSARGAVSLPEDPGVLLCPRSTRLTVLPPARGSADKVVVMPEPTPVADWQSHPAVLGLDLGSTGAKAVLVSLETRQPLLDVYDRTRGNPVDASQRLIRSITERGRPDIRAIGVTGSGRQAVATLLQTALQQTPGGDDRIVVLNEIVAHAAAARSCDPDGGDDLSVIEIGGQDAKYIRLGGGRIVESDMNKACSAGTGSFLEEQAMLYDIEDVRDLGRMAGAADRPPDLGQMCTVYVAEAAARALEQGFELGDVFAGFQYSIVHNYLDRVMGQRTLGKRVFFQGKPASSHSLACALAAVTGREIVVPPNPGAMGAWGIALSAVDALGAEALARAPRIDITEVLQAEIVQRSEFRCRDKECDTLCPIERTTIVLGTQKRVAVAGGACPKFEVATRTQPKLDKDAPNPFDAREALLTELEVPAPGRPTVALPVTGALTSHVPWLATLIHELGFAVRLLRSDGKTLAAGEQLCNSFDSCGPAKIAHAVCDTDLPWLFFPKILHVHEPDGPGGATCLTEQSMPDLVLRSLAARGRDVTVLRPLLSFAAGLDSKGLERALRGTAASLGVDPKRLGPAIERAAAAQRRFQRSLGEVTRRAIAYGRDKQLPIVLVCGAPHVIHDASANANIPRLLRQNGAMAIPVDGLAIDAPVPAMPKIYWGDANRFLRAAEHARRQGDIFPLLVNSFGCGPGSFTEQFFQSILAGHPHTVLESDGHGGAAGFVTRIQAFLQSVRQHLDGAAPPDAGGAEALSYLEHGDRSQPYLSHDVRYVFLSGTDYLGALFAAVYRAAGYDAVAAPPLSDHNLGRGRRDCSGKECLSYQMLWGAFREYLETEDRPQKPTRLVQISGESCRGGMFGIKDRINLERMGLADHVGVTALRIAGGPGMTAKIWTGLVALDVVRQLYVYHLVDRSAAELEQLYRGSCEAIVRLAEEPTERGRSPAASAAQAARQWKELMDIMERAALSFRDTHTRTPDGSRDVRTVFVSGDLLTKGCDFANGGVFFHLAERGVRSILEPTCDFLEYAARAQPSLIFGKASGAVEQAIYRLAMVRIRERIYTMVRRIHPWLPMPAVPVALELSSPMMDPGTQAYAGFSTGNVLHNWRAGGYDGVVMTSCWGCDNGLIGESLLRHERHIPAYFVYDDGSPIDERRVDAFAFRLHRRPKRHPVPPGAKTVAMRLHRLVRRGQRPERHQP